MLNETTKAGTKFTPKPPPDPWTLRDKGWFGYLDQQQDLGAQPTGHIMGLTAPPPAPALPPVDLSWMNAPAGGGGGDGGGAAAPAPAPVVFDPESNPEYLRAIADIDASEAGAIGDIRVKQEGARRALDDLLADIADREGKSAIRTKESQEGRGLLRSGATERLLADVAQAAGAERGRGQAATADQISGLERAIAEAKINAQRERGDTRLRFAGLGG